MNKTKWGLAVAAFLGAALFSSGAYAVDYFTVPEGDLAIKILRAIFGDLFGGDGGGGPAVGVIKRIIMVCLFIAISYFALGVAKGVATASQDGSSLAKSNPWMWLRWVLGVGLVAPYGSGYCAAQKLLAWTIIQGIAFANGAWQEFTKYQADHYVSQSMAMPPNPQIDQLAGKMLSFLTCQASHEKASSTDATGTFKTTSVTAGDYKSARKFGVASLSDNACGEINGAGVRGEKVSTSWWSVFSDDPKTTNEIFSDAHATASMELENALRPIAQRSVNGPLNGTDRAAYRQAILNYEKRLQQAANQVAGTNVYSEISSKAQSDGFFTAGAYYAKQAAENSSKTQGYMATPTATANGNTELGLNAQDVAQGQAALAGGMQSASRDGSDKSWWETGYAAAKDVASKTWEGAKAIASLEPLAVINNALNSASEKIFNFMTGAQSGDNFFASMRQLGVMLMIMGGTVAGAGFMADIVLDADALFLISIGFAAVSAGAYLCVLLPLQPFAIFIGACLGWIISVIVAVFGIPLAAMMLCNPDSHEQIHNSHMAKKVIALMLKPLALVGGFICAIAVFEIITKVVGGFFFTIAQASAQGNGFVLFVTLGAIIVGYIKLLSSIMNQCFAWTGTLADMLGTWLDLAGDNYSSQGSSALSGVVASAASGKSGLSSIGDGIQDAAIKRRSDKEDAGKKTGKEGAGKEGGSNKDNAIASGAEKTEKKSDTSSGDANKKDDKKDEKKVTPGSLAAAGAANAFGNFANDLKDAALGSNTASVNTGPSAKKPKDKDDKKGKDEGKDDESQSDTTTSQQQQYQRGLREEGEERPASGPDQS